MSDPSPERAACVAPLGLRRVGPACHPRLTPGVIHVSSLRDDCVPLGLGCLNQDFIKIFKINKIQDLPLSSSGHSPAGTQSSWKDDMLITPGVSQRYLHNFCRRKLALKVFGFLGKINCMQ